MVNPPNSSGKPSLHRVLGSPVQSKRCRIDRRLRSCLQSSSAQAFANSGEMEGVEEGSGEFVVAGGDGAADLEVADHALDAVALVIDAPVPADGRLAVRFWRDDMADAIGLQP